MSLELEEHSCPTGYSKDPRQFGNYAVHIFNNATCLSYLTTANQRSSNIFTILWVPISFLPVFKPGVRGLGLEPGSQCRSEVRDHHRCMWGYGGNGHAQ